MSKFKVGDKVAHIDTPTTYFGRIASIRYNHAFVKVPPRYDSGFVVHLDSLAHYQEIPDITNEEIYKMLKPKLDNSVFNGCIKFNLPIIMGFDGMEKVRCYRENEVIKAIALAYRSGYLRAKKGRAFKIGGEKE